jgi:hypothetical protein
MLPSDRGEFRGHLSADTKAVIAQWIQPASTIFSQRHATPVELTQTTKSVWRGEVVPLPEKISFYFSIRKTTNGTIAIVRNTEFEWFNGSYTVQINNQAIVLRSQSSELQGTYDGATDTLSFSLINGSPTPVAEKACRTHPIFGC